MNKKQDININEIKQGVMEQNNMDRGITLQVSDDFIYAKGLLKGGMMELVKIQSGNRKCYGVISELTENGNVSINLLGKAKNVFVGDNIKLLGQSVQLPGGKAVLGRIINSIGEPIDGKGNIEVKDYIDAEQGAPGIIERESIREQLETGVKVIDTLVPIGHGQRELIIGDAKTGKSTLAMDSIINQKKLNTICVYVLIGQKKDMLTKVQKVLENEGCMGYTCILNASVSDPSVMQYLAPYSGCAVAEYFRDKGWKTLVIYDDLSKHAIAYRQMSLLIRRPPGREGYPGDVFYAHSRLLERSAKLVSKYIDNVKVPAGSLTALPIVETIEGDVSAYITTNVISITDGQIFTEKELFSKGLRPAISPGLSVSRVGTNAQNKIFKQITGTMKIDLANYRELLEITKLGVPLDEESIGIFKSGQRLEKVLTQRRYKPVEMLVQVPLIVISLAKMLNEINLDNFADFERLFSKFLQKEYLAKIFDRIIRETFIDKVLVFIAELTKLTILEKCHN